MTHEHERDEERRKRVLTDEDINAIKDSIYAGLPIKHTRHHELFEQWLDREAKKREAREKIISQITGWGLIAVLGSIGTFAFHLVEKYIQDVAARGGH